MSRPFSDDSGNYVFENVKPGNYSVTATREGFARAVVNQVELTARQNLRVDVSLALAAQAQSVEVNASALAVDTENATLSDSKETSDITQLPINSRAVSSSPLAALAVSPAVTRDSQGNFASMENIAEMKVTASNNNAEFAQIGDVTFVTKSGTNQLHGSALEYFQDSALDATVLNFWFKAPLLAPG